LPDSAPQQSDGKTERVDPDSHKSETSSKNDTSKLDDESAKAEEIRKARLAYFKLNDPGSSPKPAPKENQTSDVSATSNCVGDDQSKLREMLRDLKHSLPKRPKQGKPITDFNLINETSLVNFKSEKEENKKPVETKTIQTYKPPLVDVSKMEIVKNKEARSEGPSVMQAKNDKRIVVGTEKDSAQIYLVESETRIEEIKVKKLPEKVSASSQTNSRIEEVGARVVSEVREDVEARKKGEKEVIVPITVESSIKLGAKRIASTKFQLMRPRDFASIEVIKTGNANGPQHLYANIAEGPSLDLPSVSSPAEPIPGPSTQCTDKGKLYFYYNFQCSNCDFFVCFENWPNNLLNETEQKVYIL
jgi:hypothetical protein